jgi:DNA segregation ATPase FtsK/SpoIIIE, S-DNA-T family
MLKENDPPAPSAEDKESAATGRDRQRGALDGLVRLVKQCAEDEARISAESAAAQQKADEDLQRERDAVGAKYRSLLEGLEETFTQRVLEAEKQFEWARDELSTKSKASRQRLTHDHDKLTEEAKGKLEQASWLADSVLEAAQIRIKEELKKAKEQAAAAEQSLAQLENQAQTTLINLGQSTPVVPDEPAGSVANLPEEFEKRRQEAEQKLDELEKLTIPRLVAGGKVYILGVLFCGLAIASPQIIAQSLVPQWGGLVVAAVLSIGITTVACIFLGIQAKKQIATAYVPFRQAINVARRCVTAMSEQAEERGRADEQAAVHTRKSEINKAKEQLGPQVEQSLKKRDAQVLVVRNEAAKRLAELEKQRDAARAAAQDWRKEIEPKVKKRRDRHLQAVQDRYDAAQFQAQIQYDKARGDLERRWSDGLEVIRAPMKEGTLAAADWSPDHWKDWKPPKTFAETIRFGEMQVDMRKIVDTVNKAAGADAADRPFTLPLPDAFALPALLAFPRQSSLLIHSDPAGREEALRMLQLVMVRLLTCLPAGRVKFTIIDPVSRGQNFAGFMHLSDFDETLVGTRIWTSKEHIEQRLVDLTEHMETVIQKYLRNEFETIDEYNAQAGELAEPYRFLVVADFPEEFEADSIRRLASIASSGARCGVYTLIARDTRLQIPSGSHFADVEAHSVNLIRKDNRFVWKDDVFRQFPLTLDGPPPEEMLTKILQKVGEGAKDASRVEVPFTSITAKGSQVWSLNSASDMGVPVGRMGATRLQYFRIGRGVAQHALIAGKTGSGKSSLLNALITNTALWYPPDQVMLYLIDFKKGVEFKTYATHDLPHACAIAVESDREFGISVLQRIDQEMNRRGELYRKFGAQDLAAYRQTPDAQPMPRILLIIDEFQEFFSEDDKLSQEAGQLLDRLVRQGRAFGTHVILGSQTLAGSSGLSRSTIGQMGVRIALQCSEADSQLILGDNNSAARLLTRPGEAIYNDAGGLVEGNSPFQVAWLPDETREATLQEIHARAVKQLGHWESPIVFEGNAPAPISKNVPLVNLLDATAWPPTPTAPAAWLGDPVAIKSPTAVVFRRQAGASLLMIGQQEEGAMAMMAAVMASLASQYPAGGAKFYILDGTVADSPLAKVLPSVKAVLPQEVQMPDYRGSTDTIAALAAELAKRQSVEPTHASAGDAEIFVLVYGVQRYRILRKSEESFSFGSGSEEEKKPDPGKQFADILRDGPGLGIHVIAWVDTPASLDRILERQAMREFDYRVLFQMSANDSSNLIDSPAANKLGANRALVYSEEQGTMEKFRPYALPDKEWLEHIRKSLAAKKNG